MLVAVEKERGRDYAKARRTCQAIRRDSDPRPGTWLAKCGARTRGRIRKPKNASKLFAVRDEATSLTAVQNGAWILLIKSGLPSGAGL